MFTIRSFRGNVSFSYASSPSRGALGGIIAIWDPDCISKKKITLSNHFIAVEAIWVRTNMEVMFISVYAPQDAISKRMLWDRLHQMISLFHGECILMGEFNVVRDESERMGSQLHAAMSNSSKSIYCSD